MHKFVTEKENMNQWVSDWEKDVSTKSKSNYLCFSAYIHAPHKHTLIYTHARVHRKQNLKTLCHRFLNS